MLPSRQRNLLTLDFARNLMTLRTLGIYLLNIQTHSLAVLLETCGIFRPFSLNVWCRWAGCSELSERGMVVINIGHKVECVVSLYLNGDIFPLPLPEHSFQ